MRPEPGGGAFSQDFDLLGRGLFRRQRFLAGAFGCRPPHRRVWRVDEDSHRARVRLGQMVLQFGDGGPQFIGFLGVKRRTHCHLAGVGTVHMTLGFPGRKASNPLPRPARR
jgi:hypothetical protein